MKRLRYALVSHSGGEIFPVADVHTFLKMMTSFASAKGKALCQELGKWWDNNFKASESMGFYDEDDIHDILKRIYVTPAEDKTPPKPKQESRGDEATRHIMGMIQQAQDGDA